MDAMMKRPLGATGLVVSALGLGTVKLGRNRALKYVQGFALPEDGAVRRLLDAAADLGITLLDTAPAYGTSEERLGQLLGSRRRHFVIASKAGEEFDGARSRFDFSPEAIRASVERSLRRLRTDCLDIILLHSDGLEETAARFGPAFAMLGELKARGLVRATGFSGKTVAGGRMALAHSDVVMVTLNPEQVAERPVIAEAAAAGKGVLIKKALGSGRHVGAAGAAGGTGGALVQAAMDFVFATPGVASVVVGTLDPAHLAKDAAAALAAIRRAPGAIP